MGIKATVVYDAVKHSAVIVRTQTVSITERYEVIDTIASFSQHCESLRGVARSATEVSAAWGGPPYVTYTVVASRFRIIVIWDERPAEFDLAHDVEQALARLESAVDSVAAPFADRRTDAVAKVYEEAGYALRGDTPIVLPDLAPDGKKQGTKQKILSKPSSGPRRSSFADPKKKPGGKGSGRLFGRIGSALKNIAGSGEDEQQASIVNSRRSFSPQHSNASLQPPSEPGGDSFVKYGSEGHPPFDDQLGDLDLSEEVFAWANFGGDVPEETGDLSWFAQLIHNEEGLRKRPRPPMLRAGSSSSTPLTIPSMGTPLSLGASGQSSVVPSEGPLALPPVQDSSQVSHTQTPSIPSPPSRAPSSITTAGKPPVPPTQPISSVPPGGTQQPHAAPQQVPLPQQIPGSLGQSQQHSSRTNYQQQQVVRPAAPSATLHGGGQGGVLPNQSFPNMGMVPGGVHPAAAAGMLPQAASAQPPNGPPHYSLPQTPSMGSASFSGSILPAGQSATLSKGSTTTPQTAATGYATPQVVPSPSSASMPPALAAELKAMEDFDVAALGSYKDNSIASGPGQLAATVTGSTGGGVTKQNDDEAIRARMNEFAVTMQAGNFTLALQQVFATLKLLKTVQPRRERETVTCANYVLAQKILIRNTTLETELTRVPAGTPEAVRRHIEGALLTMFLAELKHLLPRHRVAAMKVAVDKNFVVGNYGMCARWLRLLVEKAPEAQKGEFRQRLELCVRNGERNAQMPPTNRLCYITLQVLLAPYGRCNVCGAVYHAQMAGVVAGQVCPTCFVGAIEAQMN